MPDNIKPAADFNAAYQAVVTTSGVAIIKRTCALQMPNALCQKEEMIYKRKNPSASFAPYAPLLTAWSEGADNKFQEDFELFPSLPDAL